MSLSRTSSSIQLSTPTLEERTDESTDQEKSATTNEKQGLQSGTDAGTEKKKKEDPAPPKKPKLTIKPPVSPRKFDAPKERARVFGRERSVSSPLILQPIPNSDKSDSLSSQTPDGKSTSASRKSKDMDAVNLLPSSISSTPTKAQPDAPLPSTAPKLRTKKPNPARKSLTLEQQLASDLADLLDKQLLRKQGKPDDEIAVSQMTLGLQRYSGKPANATVSIKELMLKMFSDEMKKTDAWEIASQAMVKIRSAYFRGRDETSVLNEKSEKEAADMLAFLAAGFAGAFFNVSGSKKRSRLPEKLRFFLQAADHRQIRILFSSDAGIKMSHEKLMQLRKDSLEKVLLDTFLAPLVLKEFSLQSGTIESNNTAAQIIQSLHAALSVSAQEFLDESIKSAPDDVAELMLKHKMHHFKPRMNKAADESSPGKKKNYLLSGPSSLAKTSSINQQRRGRLKQILDATIAKIAPHTLSDEMLAAIKSYNNEFAASVQAIDTASLVAEWMDIAKKIDAKASVVSSLQELVNFHVEQSAIDRELVVTDLEVKLRLLENEKGLPEFERARRISSDQPIVLPSLFTASTSRTPVSSSSTPSSTPPSTSTSPMQGKVPRSPASPSTRTVQHKRSKTADVLMPAEKNHASKITSKQRDALIKAYPELLLRCVMRAAMHNTPTGELIKNDPLSGIWQVGRIAFEIPQKDIPLAVRVKIAPAPTEKKKSPTISHTDLLKLLVGDALKASPAGKTIESRRAKALQIAGKSLSVEELVSQRDQIAEKKSLSEKFQPLADALVTDVFSQGLAKAGLPGELIEICKAFDRELTTWIDWALIPLMARMPTITPPAIDGLRSNLIFDLMLTRSLYTLLMATEDPAQSVNVTSFASAFKNSIKKMWDSQLFDDFKAMQAADAGEGEPTVSISSASSTSGVGSVSSLPSPSQKLSPQEKPADVEPNPAVNSNRSPERVQQLVKVKGIRLGGARTPTVNTASTGTAEKATTSDAASGEQGSSSTSDSTRKQ